MEDWWLVRGAQGQTGWLYSHLIDVSVPETIARYAEGQRIVGAYILATVDDPESGVLSNGQTITAIPEYVSVLNSGKSGLPYDFDQVRVYTWNTKKHRYETAYRQRNIQGYLPVKISEGKNGQGQTVPEFSITVARGEAAPLDPTTGMNGATETAVLTYQLESGMVKRATAGASPNTAQATAKSPAAPARAHHRGKKTARGA